MGAYSVSTRDVLGTGIGHFATLEAASEAFAAQIGYIARHSELHPATIALMEGVRFYGVYDTQGEVGTLQTKA